MSDGSNYRVLKIVDTIEDLVAEIKRGLKRIAAESREDAYRQYAADLVALIEGPEASPTPVDHLAEEVGYWRREALARLQMAIWLHRGLQQRSEDRRAADVRIEMRTTLAALDAADKREWHTRCALCGQFMLPADPVALVALGDPDDLERAHASCARADVGYVDGIDAAAVIAEARAIAMPQDDTGAEPEGETKHAG